MRAPAIVLLAALASACEPPATHPVNLSAVVLQAELDPFTVLGADFAQDDMVDDWLGAFLCSQTNIFVMHLAAQAQGSTGFGHVTFVVGLLEDGEPCDGSGVLSVQPASIGTDGEYLVQGPASVEGQNVEAHIPLGDLPGETFMAFPSWWTLSLNGGDTAIGERMTIQELREGELSALWTVPQLATVHALTGERLIDLGVSNDLQPDVDVDFDGLERYLDTNGDGVVDACVDGPGGDPVYGAECFEGIRFADAYEIRLRLRLAKATLLDPPPLN